MTRDDARNLLLAIQAVQPYVPPMFFNQITVSRAIRELEVIANMPEPPPFKPDGEHKEGEEPPKSGPPA